MTFWRDLLDGWSRWAVWRVGLFQEINERVLARAAKVGLDVKKLLSRRARL